MAIGTDKTSLDRRYLLIALLPTLIFLVSQLLLKYYGEPWDVLPERVAEFDAYKEGAARMALVGASILFFGSVLAGLLFFAVSLWEFHRDEAGLMVVGFLILASAAVLTQQVVIGRPAEEYAGLSLFCLAAGYGESQSATARAEEQAAAERAGETRAGEMSRRPAIPPGVAVRHLPQHATCPYSRFTRMKALLAWQFRGTALAFAGLVFAGIFCLTGPGKRVAQVSSGPPSGSDSSSRHWELQSEWLNASLYLSALLLATNLLFIHAFLHWPSFMLANAQGRDAYMDTMVSFYGFAFSLMLVSYYVPAAVILASRAQKGKGGLPEAFKGPMQIVKIVLGLSSTALAGALPGILDMIAGG